MDAAQLGTGIFAVCSAFWAALQTYQKGQTQKQLNHVAEKAVENTEAAAVSRQYANEVARLQTSLEEWRQRYDANDAQHCTRYDKLHEEHQKHTDRHEADRKHWHGKAETDNEKQLRLQEENATLRARTDLKPLIDVLVILREDMREDAGIRVRILEGLNSFSESVNRIHQRLDTLEEKHETSH